MGFPGGGLVGPMTAISLRCRGLEEDASDEVWSAEIIPDDLDGEVDEGVEDLEDGPAKEMAYGKMEDSIGGIFVIRFSEPKPLWGKM